jgi:hypothetical protein
MLAHTEQTCGQLVLATAVPLISNCMASSAAAVAAPVAAPVAAALAYLHCTAKGTEI